MVANSCIDGSGRADGPGAVMPAPSSGSILYQAGFKYQLKAPYRVRTPILPKEVTGNAFLRLTTSGDLHIRAGYAWDGPSGPAFDTPNIMRGSLVHDALYQLMRECRIDHAEHRKEADRLLRQHCREDGMSWIRSWWVYAAVRLFGEPAAWSCSERPVKRAPRPRKRDLA